MKRTIKLLISLSLSLLLIQPSGYGASAQFSDKGKHWYYSDDLSFKYWGLTDVNEYGMPVSQEALESISFNGAAPCSVYKTGQEDYVITVYVNQVPTDINVKIGLRGDSTGDGTTDLYDAILISRYLINTYSFGGGFREFAADYNLDGVVDLYDAVDISKMLIQNSIENELAERQKKEEYVNRVFELVNKERISRGLKALTLDNSLCNAAQKRATEISSNMSHTRPDGKEFFTVLKEMNISYNYAGENIGGGYSSPEAVVKGWMNSEGHRDNILDPYFTKMGVGYYEKSDTQYQYYWTQFFIQD